MSVYAPTRIVRRWFDGYRQAAADLGYVPDPEKIAFSVPVYVADTDARAHLEARPALDWLYHKGLKQTAEMVTPPGYMSPGSLRGVLLSGMRGFAGSGYEDLLAAGQAVVGSPASVAARLRELYDELGGEQLRAAHDLLVRARADREQPDELPEAAEVMPVLRPVGTS